MPHVAQLNCDQMEARGSSQRAYGPLTDERAGDDGSRGFHHKLIGVSARVNLRASDLSAHPPVGPLIVGQISPSFRVSPPAARLICLLLRSQIECVHSGRVNR